jgi:hypothetical protein
MDQSEELLTPTILCDGSVNKINPTLTSSDNFSLDDNDICFSSIPSKKNEYEMTTKDNMNTNSDNNHQMTDDFFASLHFSDFNEFDKIGKKEKY